MKTIIMTAYEGVEARNIFRTQILPTIISHRDIRVVMLMKNQERVEVYRREFSHPRIFFQITPYSTEPQSKLDAVFSWLRFALLRTETTNLHRRIVLDVERNYFSYVIGHFFNLIIACPLVLRVVRFLDYRLIHTNIYGFLFDQYKPDVVFLAHLFGDIEIHLLREARRRGIYTIGFINSWDKVTTRGIVRLLPDLLIVPNEIVKNEVLCHDDIKEHRIFVSGVPQFDMYFSGKPSPREIFFKRLNVGYEKKLIVYAPMGQAFSDSDWDLIDLLYSLRDQGKFGKDVEILVRFQPNDTFNEEELKKRPHVRCDYPGIRFADYGYSPLISTRGIDWDMSFDDLQHLYDTMYYMSLLVCYASTIAIDAAIFDKPIINIAFEIRKNDLMMRSPSIYFSKTHYKNALKTGAIRLAHSIDDLAESVRDCLGNPHLNEDGRKKLVHEQCAYLDGKAGERIGNIILDCVDKNTNIRQATTSS